MSTPGSGRGLEQRNAALREELISLVSINADRVRASEDFFERRQRFREEFAEVSRSAKISHNLGSVTVFGDGRLRVDLDPATIAKSDATRLGERILTALGEAERELARAAAQGLTEIPRS